MQITGIDMEENSYTVRGQYEEVPVQVRIGKKESPSRHYSWIKCEVEADITNDRRKEITDVIQQVHRLSDFNKDNHPHVIQKRY